MESLNFPYLPILVFVGDQSFAVQALLDTGFDGDILLPEDLLTAQSPDTHVHWTLADGSEVSAPIFIGEALLGDLPRFPVLVSTVGNVPLAGRGVSDRFSILLDHGPRLVVEP